MPIGDKIHGRETHLCRPLLEPVSDVLEYTLFEQPARHQTGYLYNG